ncbi:MAG: transglutaminase domain-containing protein [Acidimicrobiales bacterium]
MRLAISHENTYRYDTPVSSALQEVRLWPRGGPAQLVHDWTTTIEGGRVEVEFDDQFSNRVQLVSVMPGATETTVRVEGDVETFDMAGVLGDHSGHAPLWLFKRATELTEAGPGLRELVAGLERADPLGTLHALAAATLDRVDYVLGSTETSSTAEQVLAQGSGVCQDHSHIFLSGARALGHPARYVSGYLMMNDRVDQDATHAWAEVWTEGLGWVGFDVSNGISPDERYVRIATGLDYADAAPISGLRFGTGGERLHVSVQVQQ